MSRGGQATGNQEPAAKKRILAKSPPRTGLEPPRSARWRLQGPPGGPLSGGAQKGQPLPGSNAWGRVFTLLRDQYWSRGERVPVPGPVVGAAVFRAAGGGRASWVDLRHRGRGA